MEANQAVTIGDAVEQANWLMTGEKMLKVVTDLTEVYTEAELIALEQILAARRKQVGMLRVEA